MLKKIKFLNHFPLPLKLNLTRIFLKIKLKTPLSSAETELVNLFDYLLAVDGRLLEENEKGWQILYPGSTGSSSRASLRKNSSDAQVFRQVVVEGEYAALTQFIQTKGFSSAIRYILDAGANIGLTTLHLKQHFPAAEVIAIEIIDYFKVQAEIQNQLTDNGFTCLASRNGRLGGKKTRNIAPGWLGRRPV